MKKGYLALVASAALLSTVCLGNVSNAEATSSIKNEVKHDERKITIENVTSGLKHVSGSGLNIPGMNYDVFINGKYTTQARIKYVNGEIKYSTEYIFNNKPLSLKVGDIIKVEAYTGDGAYFPKKICATFETTVSEGISQPEPVLSDLFNVNPIVADTYVHVSGTSHPDAEYYQIFKNNEYMGKALNKGKIYTTDTFYTKAINVKRGDIIKVEAVSGDGDYIPLEIWAVTETTVQ